jgi:F-type H+-transporting ATPase subunit b
MKMDNRPGRLWRIAVLLALVACLFVVGVALGAEEAAHAGHEGISPAMITDFTWRSVNFLVFAGLLIYLLAKKVNVKEFFAKRSQDIAQSLEDLEAKKAATAIALKETEARLAEVAKEREAIIKQYMAEGEVEKAKILDKANQVAVRLKEMASLTIEQETRKATQALRVEVADLATKLAEDLIKEKATFADQQVLVEEYLKKVVEAH